MNILVLTAHTKEIEDYSLITTKNKEEYCTIYNYDYLDITEGFDEKRPYSWSKIKFIKENLINYDWIFWIDADTLIMRFDIRLEDIIDEYLRFDIIIGEEDFGFRQNASAGVFFIKNSPFSFSFLDEIYRQEQFINHKWWEQMSIIYLLSESNYPNIKLIPARTFNSMIINDSYYKGDFICHFAGLQYTASLDRFTMISEYINDVDKKIKNNHFDIIFLSYNEPIAEKNYHLLKSKYPFAKRVNGIKGLINALEVAAKLAESDYFYLIDADNVILPTFDFSFNPYIEDRKTYIWQARNNVNSLEYGYGGVKMYKKEEVLLLISEIKNKVNLDTLKQNEYHFLWLGDYPLTKDFKIVKEVASVTIFNSSEFDAWKGAFRECCKLAAFTDFLKLSQKQKKESEERLQIWCDKGKEAEFGMYAIDGAREGKLYGILNKKKPHNLLKINDFEWLKSKFQSKYKTNVLNR